MKYSPKTYTESFKNVESENRKHENFKSETCRPISEVDSNSAIKISDISKIENCRPILEPDLESTNLNL